MLGLLLRDFRYACRLYARNPLAAATVVATLGVGLGCSTAVFSALNAVLLKPLPYGHPDRLLFLSERNRQLSEMEVSYPDYQDWRSRAASFSSMFTYQLDEMNLKNLGRPDQVSVCKISSGFLRTLEISPHLGRGFGDSDDYPGSNPAALLSYAYWQQALGGDPAVVGRKLLLDDRLFTVAGVLPPNFRLMLTDQQPKIYVPIGLWADALSNRRLHAGLYVIARLRPNVDWKRAQAEMSVVAAGLEREHPETNSGLWATVMPLSARVVHDSELVLLLASGAVALVLFIACANVANLMLAWSAAREREISMRAALGGSQARIFRQVLTENLTLACFGGILGFLLSYGGIGAIRLIVPDSLREVIDLSVDTHVLAFAVALSLLTGLVFGYAPALASSRLNLNDVLRGSQQSAIGAKSSKQRLRSLVVIGEVSLTLILLIGAQLMISSAKRLLDVRPGFNANNLLLLETRLEEASYPNAAQVTAFYRESLLHLRNAAHVVSASVVTSLPFSDAYTFSYVLPEGWPLVDSAQTPLSDYHVIDTDYFRTMEIPLMEGRNFNSSDSAGAPPVVIVSEFLARRYWPKESAVGKRLKLGAPSSSVPWAVVIGVSGNAKQTALEIQSANDYYRSYLQSPVRKMTFVVRTDSDPVPLSATLVDEIRAVDRDVRVANARTMANLLSDSIAPQKITGIVLTVLAGVGLMLTSIGVYAVLFQNVRRRTREIGIRMALGASRNQVLRLVMTHSARMILFGLAIGWIGAIVSTRLMQTLLFSIGSFDPITYMSASLILAGVGVLASLMPAAYATNVRPVTALRVD